MKVETHLFGSVEVNPNSIISFPNGLVSFEENKRFMLIHEENTGEPASFTLQSVDDPDLAFQIIDPVALGFHYELSLTDSENALLQTPVPSDVAVMLILFNQDGEKPAISPNLRAPLVINTKAMVGLQKVMENIQPNITLSNLANLV